MKLILNFVSLMRYSLDLYILYPILMLGNKRACEGTYDTYIDPLLSESNETDL